jgi:Polyketide cyclase / dehydrase and lipid transport
MKAILGILAVILLVVVGYLAWTSYQIRQAAVGPAKEIVSESMSKSGDVWHVSFVSKFDAPVDKVYEIFSHPERSHDLAPENVLKSELVSEQGNTKVIDLIGKLDILPPGFKVQNIRTEYTLDPQGHRITSKTVDFKLADIASEYKFEPTPDGKGTLLRFNQTSKDKGGIPVESVQKGALRETYVTQIRAVNRALGLTPADQKRAAG